jgi:hypothetical protein
MDEMVSASYAAHSRAAVLGTIVRKRLELLSHIADGETRDYLLASEISETLQGAIRGTLDRYELTGSLNANVVLPIMIQYAGVLADASLAAIGSGSMRNARILIEHLKIIGDAVSELAEKAGFGDRVCEHGRFSVDGSCLQSPPCEA